MSPQARRAVIFDLDGVLVDTAGLHWSAWQRLAERYGVPLDTRLEPHLRGLGRRESLDVILDRADRVFSQAEKEAMAAEKNADYVSLVDTLGPDDLLPGARRALEASRARGLGVALGSASRNAPHVLVRLGIGDLFDYVVDAGSVSHSKPAPDIFQAAAAGLGLEAVACVGVEDAPAGVTAVKRAGMAAIGVGEPAHLSHADLIIPAIAAYDPDTLP